MRVSASATSTSLRVLTMGFQRTCHVPCHVHFPIQRAGRAESFVCVTSRPSSARSPVVGLGAGVLANGSSEAFGAQAEGAEGLFEACLVGARLADRLVQAGRSRPRVALIVGGGCDDG